MYNFLKKGAYMLFVASLAVGMVACDDDDPDYSHVTPPTVEVAASHISGVVTAMNGQAVSGATVKAILNGQEKSATTGADGAYVLSEVEKGTYTLEVSAAGKLTVTGQVKLNYDGESAVFNAILTNEGQSVEVSAEEDKQLSLVTETLPNNEEAEVKTDILVPAGAVAEEGAVITVTPVYSKAMQVSRAVENTMVLGMHVACNQEGVELQQPISLTFHVGADMAAATKVTKTVNGQTKVIQGQVNGDELVVKADELGTYSLTLDIQFSQATANEALRFSQDKFDNLYGAKDLLVKNATYTYKHGADLGEAADGVLEAHLRQVLAVKAGASSVKEANGTYDLNVTLPIGTALNLSGHQQVTTHTATVGTASSSMKTYGNVSVSAATYNRDHIGGGSNE